MHILDERTNEEVYMRGFFGASGEAMGSVAESQGKAMAELVGLQRRNVGVVQGIYEKSVEQLYREVEIGAEAGARFVENLERQREAQEELLKETAGAYVDFLYSPFYAGDELEKKFQAPAAVQGEAQDPAAGQEEEQHPPIEGYDELNVNQVSEKLDGLSSEELEQVKGYEETTKNRETVLREISGRLEPVPSPH
jgi:hypothetical protein